MVRTTAGRGTGGGRGHTEDAEAMEGHLRPGGVPVPHHEARPLRGEGGEEVPQRGARLALRRAVVEVVHAVQLREGGRGGATASGRRRGEWGVPPARAEVPRQGRRSSTGVRGPWRANEGPGGDKGRI